MSAAIKRKTVAGKIAADKSSLGDVMTVKININIINASTSIKNALSVVNIIVNVNRSSFLSTIILVVSAVVVLESVTLAIPIILPANVTMKSHGLSGMSGINR